VGIPVGADDSVPVDVGTCCFPLFENWDSTRTLGPYDRLDPVPTVYRLRFRNPGILEALDRTLSLHN
jgi:hypothetical protein